MTKGEQAGQSGASGSRKTVAGIFQGQRRAGGVAQLLQGQPVGLRIGLLAGHIFAAHPEGEVLAEPPQQVLRQGRHRGATAGGHDHLAQASCSSSSDQLSHPGAQPQLAGGHQSSVMVLLAGLQLSDQLWRWRLAQQLRESSSDALPATADGQQLAIAGGIPMQRHTNVCKGPVEGQAMAIPLGLRQGAVDIPEQGLQGHQLLAPGLIRLGLIASGGCGLAAGPAQ